MKKWISLLLSLGMLISLMGCGRSDDRLKENMTTGGDFVLSKPPALEYISGEQTFTATGNGYSWSYDNFDGTWNNTIADSVHPLDSGELMQTVVAEGDTLTLVFEVAPESYTVRCWPDTAMGTGDTTGEQAVSTDGWEIRLLDGGYVYQVIAQWEYESFHGNAYYCFHVDTHSHLPAAQPQTVENPVSGYCGNTLTTVNWEGKSFSLIDSTSITLTDIVINLAYAPENVCRCTPEFFITTEDGTVYGINLTRAFVRCNSGQAGLTDEQITAMETILRELS